MNTEQKLNALREEMKNHGLDAYLIPRGDEYQGEFVAAYAERLQWLTGFTGSAGMGIVFVDKALVLSDSRYTLQMRKQLDPEHYTGGDYILKKAEEWILETMSKGVIGFDPWLHTKDQIENLSKKLGRDFELKPVDRNLIDQIWDDQPQPPKGQVYLFPEEIAGRSVEEKKDLLLKSLKDKNLDAYIFTAPDSTAWLLNIRGGDVPYIPYCLSVTVLDIQKGVLHWFVDPDKLGDDVHSALAQRVTIHDIAGLSDFLKGQAGKTLKTIGVDKDHHSYALSQMIEDAGGTCVNENDPCIMPRACKTKTEQDSIEQAHIQDGVALVKFLHWLEGAGAITELDVADKLEEFRSESPDYLGPSFPTIAGFGENGAIVHYRASAEQFSPIEGSGLLLVDSGGQYKGGTTDITRTILIGEVRADYKKHFTLVLKGHIALAQAEFPDGVNGAHLDVLTRQYLWHNDLDYGHGTGHGVGCHLCVHESGAGISLRAKTLVKPGMLISNEPGYYEEGSHGIRIENLIFCEDTGRKTSLGQALYTFKTVSLCPIDLRLIDADMLSANEKLWINSYHKMVFETLGPLLDNTHKEWLEGKTKLIL